MVYPAAGEDAGGYLFEEDDDYDQDAHVARLEEENLTLKERLFLMEQEVGDMRRRLEALEARFPQTDGALGGGRPENDGNINVGSENSSEDVVERVTDVETDKGNIPDKGAVDLENGYIAGKSFLDLEKELAEEKAAVDSVNSDQPNAVAGKSFMDLEKELAEEKAAVDSENSGQPKAENSALGSEESGKHNAEVAVDLENGVEHDDSEKVDVDLENSMEHDDSEKVAVDSEKSGEHDAEMVDVVLEKSGADGAGQKMFEASTRD
ncbi:hypothetical protein PR202_ga03497 [Eleusine coracana subsp. coracana]|uniref:Uncharacterized protein n=1 Tax=Eleusine coracana subsp. coracana TaxID=191504 RepID=A0AAV5BPF5_ELECO|nr:hypothetical protein PR202_ga03497 [Eleusine coracana subsp. coracana]